MRLFVLSAALVATSMPGPAAGPHPAAAPVQAPFTARSMPVLDPAGERAEACPPTSRYDAARRAPGLRAQPLGQLPAADQYLAVYRTIGACEVPIVANYGIGASPGR